MAKNKIYEKNILKYGRDLHFKVDKIKMWYIFTTHRGETMITFGAFIKSLRIKNSLTLREFCRIAKLDASNWSKIERDLLPPPKSRQILEGIAGILNLQAGSEDMNTLFDLAAISYIPPELIGDQKVVDKLPVFFRTIRGEKPTRKELEQLIETLKEE